jgi:hypothetical protein
MNCDLRGGKKSQRNAPAGFRFRGGLKQAHTPSLVTSFGDGRSLGQPAQGHEVHCSCWFRFGAMWLYEPVARKSSAVTGESTSPGEDPTGASAERELGFGPQPKAGRAQGECKGAREVLARHGRTAQPRGGPWPGGVLMAHDPTPNGRPSRVACALLVMAFDGIYERGGAQRAPQTPGNWVEAP